MKAIGRFAAVFAAGAAVLSLLGGSAQAGPAAITCGNHMEPVNGDPYHRQYFWGNCTGQAVKINVWFATYSGAPPFEHFDKQLCAPANQDTLVGETLNYVVSRYYVKDTAGPC